MTKEKDEPKCDCLFCNSKCPDCGSTNIDVTLKVEYGFSNDSIDSISISQGEDGIELECKDCDSNFFKYEFRYNEKLDPLRLALFEVLELPENKRVDFKDREIEVTEYKTVSVEKSF